MHFSRLFKVKQGKEEKIRQWFETLNGSRREEAIATFAYENVTREVFAMFKDNDNNYYVVGFNEMDGPLQKGDPNVKINQEHNAIREECLEPMSERGEVLFDAKRN